MTSTLTQHETPNRDVSEDGARFWHIFIDPDMPGYNLFGSDTVGIVDELAGGIVAYATEANALAIINAIRQSLGEV